MFQFNEGFQFNISDFMKYRRAIAVACSADLTKPEVKFLKRASRTWYDIGDTELRALITQALGYRHSIGG